MFTIDTQMPQTQTQRIKKTSANGSSADTRKNFGCFLASVFMSESLPFSLVFFILASVFVFASF